MQSGCFIVEGEKIVEDLIQRNWEIVELYARTDWLEQISSGLQIRSKEVYEVNQDTLKKLSLLSTPHRVLAVARMPDYNELPEIHKNDLVLALDDIQDPGNMGTIIRIASWFGINIILNSMGCVDIFNPKVVQASMSAIFDVRVFRGDIPEYLEKIRTRGGIVFGTFPEGEIIYNRVLPSGGVILLGNESRGISPVLLPLIDYRLSIPFTPGIGTRSVESLNVASAAAIICSEFRRRKF